MKRALRASSILAPLANAVLLFAVATYVLFESVRRLLDPPDVLSTPMLIVAVVGLVVNVVAWRLLRQGAEESINVKGAYLEVLADLAGSVGVIVAAAIMIVTGWLYANPILDAWWTCSSCHVLGVSVDSPSVSSPRQPRAL